jgi:hypothetical protein
MSMGRLTEAHPVSLHGIITKQETSRVCICKWDTWVDEECGDYGPGGPGVGGQRGFEDEGQTGWTQELGEPMLICEDDGIWWTESE